MSESDRIRSGYLYDEKEKKRSEYSRVSHRRQRIIPVLLHVDVVSFFLFIDKTRTKNTERPIIYSIKVAPTTNNRIVFRRVKETFFLRAIF